MSLRDRAEVTEVDFFRRRQLMDDGRRSADGGRRSAVGSRQETKNNCGSPANSRHISLLQIRQIWHITTLSLSQLFSNKNHNPNLSVQTLPATILFKHHKYIS